ncbi:MAG: DNA repair protein RecO [candidate division WWE3 bacterium]|nr:DNA repair protein RecO [candidate division WWE3 bacterium]
MAQTFLVTGVIIKRSNYREADKWLTLITREKGKIRVLAKGLRKLSSKRGGKLELFNLVRLQVAPGKAYLVAAEVETLETFPKFRQDLAKLSLVFTFAEIVDVLTAEEQVNVNSLGLLTNFLRQSESLSQTDLEELLTRSLGELLKNLGFWDGLYLQEKMTKLSFIESYVETITEKRLRSSKALATSSPAFAKASAD